MNRRSILTKTGKGLMEVTGKTSALSRDHRNILKEIDGKVSVSELMQKFAKMTEPELLEALRSMEREGYLREFVGKEEDASRPHIPRTPRRGARPKSGSAGKPKRRRAAKRLRERSSRRSRRPNARPRSASAGRSRKGPAAKPRRGPGTRARRARVAKRKRR